nr:MAG TPA: hypothetical protein [Caudoviricetes sp.]
MPFKQGVRGSNPRWSTKRKSLQSLRLQALTFTQTLTNVSRIAHALGLK